MIQWCIGRLKCDRSNVPTHGDRWTYESVIYKNSLMNILFWNKKPCDFRGLLSDKIYNKTLSALSRGEKKLRDFRWTYSLCNFLKCHPKLSLSDIFCLGGKVVLWSDFPFRVQRNFKKKMARRRESRWAAWKEKCSHQKCSVGKGVLRNFSKFTGKHLCQSLFYNKAAGDSGTGVFLWSLQNF